MTGARRSSPLFITLEGIEGSGKSTQIPLVADLLRSAGMDCVVTREPGGTAVGSRIRSILLDPDNRGLHPYTELLLYAADRSQHIRERILPALKAGKTVLCDRYVDATLAYQGIARGLGVEIVRSLHQLTMNDLMPDLTLLFDLAPEVGLKRAWQQLENGSRAAAESRFEAEAAVFHQRVREGYLKLCASEPDRFWRIDAEKDLSDVTDQVRRIIETEVLKPTGAHLGKRGSS